MTTTPPSILPEPDPETVFGLYAGGLSVDAISAKTGLSTSAVQDAIQDARTARPQIERRENRVTHELHRALVAKLTKDPGPVIECGLQNVERMLTRPRDPVSRRWVERWGELLAGPLDTMTELMLAPGHDAEDMRQMSPFVGALTEPERLLAIRKASSHAMFSSLRVSTTDAPVVGLAVASMNPDPEDKVAKVLREERAAMHEDFGGEQALLVFSDAVITLEPNARARAERITQDAQRALVAEAIDAVMPLGIQTHYAGSAEARIHAAVRRLVSELQLQGLIDRGALAIRAELAAGDLQFALRLVVDLLTHAGALRGSGGVPLLRMPASTRSREFDTFILAGIRFALGAEETQNCPWAAPVPLPEPWVVYSSVRRMTPAWRKLSIRETPEELAAANIFIRERSLKSF